VRHQPIPVTLNRKKLTFFNVSPGEHTGIASYKSNRSICIPRLMPYALTLSSTRSDLGVSRLSLSSKLLKPLNPHRESIALSSSHPEHGVVNIFSPVKIAFAPAMNAYHVSLASSEYSALTMACSVSLNVCLPAASRMIDLGKTIRAVAIVRRTVWTETG
jgi:hypothetical protein